MMRPLFYFFIIVVLSLLLIGCGKRNIKSKNPPSVEISRIDPNFYYSVLLYSDLRRSSGGLGNKKPMPGNYLMAIPASIENVKNTLSDALKTTRFANIDWEHGTLTNNHPYSASNALFWGYRRIRTDLQYRNALISEIQQQIQSRQPESDKREHLYELERKNKDDAYRIELLKKPNLGFDSLYLSWNRSERKILPNDIDLWTVRSASSESRIDFIDSSITLIDATSFFPEKETPITVIVLQSRGEEVYGSYLKWKECGGVFCQWKLVPRRVIGSRTSHLLEASLFDIGEMIRLKYSALPASMLRDFLPSEEEYIIQKEK